MPEPVIIGSGPAAAAAAITARKAQINTTILTGKALQLTAEPAPLESIHPGTEVLLQRLGLNHALNAARQSVYDGIWSGGQFNSLSTDHNQTWYGSHICRKVFDQILLETVIKHGVHCITESKIRQVTQKPEGYTITLSDGNKLHADFLIDASGKARRMGKHFGFQEYHLSKPLTCWSGVATGIPPEMMQTLQTSFLTERTSWTWLAPHPPECCTWTRLAVTKSCDLKPPPMLEAFCRDGKIRSTNVQWRLFQPVAMNRLFLIGDAAGVLDPGTGQGIFRAINSGIKAAAAVIDIIRFEHAEETILRQYHNWYTSDYLRSARQLQSHYDQLGFGNHFFPEQNLD